MTIAQQELALVAAAKNGDQHAAAELCRMHSGFVWKCAHRVKSRHLDVEDLAQHGFAALVEMIPRFDAARGCRFLTLAGRAIQQEMWREAALAHRSNRMLRFGEAIDSATTFSDPADAAESGDMTARVHGAIDRLPPRLQTILRQRMSGMTLGEIGDAEGVCKERVRQLERRAREILVDILSTGEAA